MKTEILTKTGLEVYDKYDVWQVSEDKELAHFATPGILISIKFYPREEFLNPKWCNKFVADIQYDYRNPDLLDSFDFVKHSGTYGETMFFKTMDAAIKGCEAWIDEMFEGVRDFHSREIVSKAQVSIREVAKKEFFHHKAMFPDTRNFEMEALEKSKYYAEYLSYTERYKNRRISDEKYEKKLSKIFKKTFTFPLAECLHQFKFDFGTFAEKRNIKKGWKAEDIKENLSDYELKLVRKAANYYSY